MIKLSIIIPMYNTEPYIDQLLKALAPQLTEEVEVIVIDDGSDFPYLAPFPGIKVCRQNNKGVSAARNKGLKLAKGKYIVFIDSDDMVAPDYVSHIFKSIENEPDTVYISWKHLSGPIGKIIKGPDDEFNPYNRCVWNRVFKRSYIKGLFFDEGMQVAEDDDFLKRLPVPKSKTYISEPIYIYRSGREGSLTDRARNGEFQKPEIVTQVVVYCGNTQVIGGIETFIYNFCRELCEYYDILVLYTDHMDGKQIMRLSEFVQVRRNNGKLIQCNVAINIRLTDDLPSNVRYKKRIQMSHTCQLASSGPWHWTIKQNYDELIFVSKAAADSFADQNLKYDVIHNFTDAEIPRKSLLLVSACRLTWEKGEERIYQLAEQFRNANIPFVWLVFSGQPLKKIIPGVVHCPTTLDVRSYFQKADYVVQLSDIESFCYTLREALELGTPVLTTPISVLPEIGFVNGQNGYCLPFDMKNIDVQQIYSKIPKFEPIPCENNKLVKEWKKHLGKTEPTHSYQRGDDMITVRVVEGYGDLELGRNLIPGDVVKMRRERAMLIIGRGLGEWEE